jgi:glycosyltransferase involved in cell wall biosynthesis
MALKRALSLPFLRIANASWMKWYLEDTLGIECELLIGGINREVFHPVDVKRDREVFRILCTGDPRERKGMDTIHRAFDLVTRSGQDIVTRRAGDALDLRTDDLVRSGNERTELFTYHGLGIPQEKMAETYSSADLFVDAQWYAGWNNPVAEAMACGVPVVCTDIGGVSDFAFHEETAVLFPAGDADRLASAITRMIVDTSLRERLKRNALNRIARFDWDESARRLHHLLENRLA